MQEYVREFAICLATGGASVKEDPYSEAAQRLGQLAAEQKRLFVTTATVDFKKYNRFMASGIQTSSMGSAFASQRSHWAQLAVSLVNIEQAFPHAFCS